MVYLDELRRFIGTVQSLYQVRAAYHNFQHALDVVQATFYILVSSGILPPFEGTISSTSHLPHHTKFSPVSTLITPKHALAALVAALGHDAGHPGVTNAFLIGAKSTLARIYNDRSVLESFHSVATLSLLLDLWPGLFLADDVEESTDRFRQGGAGFRRVIADVILSTDMGLHFEFMEKFERLKTEVLEAATGGESKDTAQVLEKRRIMVLCMILKCADISNVVCLLLVGSNFYIQMLITILGTTICDITCMVRHATGGTAQSECVGRISRHAPAFYQCTYR